MTARRAIDHETQYGGKKIVKFYDHLRIFQDAKTLHAPQITLYMHLLSGYFQYILRPAILNPNKSTHMTATDYREFLLSPCLFV